MEKNDLIININGNNINLSEFNDDSPAYKVRERLLQTVVFEIQHEPHLEAMSKKHEIVKLFSDRNPQINYSQVGNSLEDGLVFNCGSWAFVTYSQKTSIECNEYKSFADFYKEALSFLKKYHQAVNLPQIFRIGLRYVNKIAIGQSDLFSPSGMFTLNLKFLDDQIKFFSLDFTHVVENNLLARSIFMPQITNNKADLFWDNDIFLPMQVEFDAAIGLLPVMHQAATNLFLRFLTDQAKKKLLIIEGEE